MHTISIYKYGGHVEDIKRAIRRSDPSSVMVRSRESGLEEKFLYRFPLRHMMQNLITEKFNWHLMMLSQKGNFSCLPIWNLEQDVSLPHLQV